MFAEMHSSVGGLMDSKRRKHLEDSASLHFIFWRACGHIWRLSREKTATKSIAQILVLPRTGKPTEHSDCKESDDILLLFLYKDHVALELH